MLDHEGHVTQSTLRAADHMASIHPKRVVVQWNSQGQPIGDSGGLLSQCLGLVACNFDNFPIMYDNWKNVLPPFKENVYETNIKVPILI